MLPEKLQKMYDEALTVKTKILDELKPLREEENELQGKLDTIAKDLRKVRDNIVAIEQPALAEASLMIKALRKTPGGKSLKAESGEFGIKMT